MKNSPEMQLPYITIRTMAKNVLSEIVPVQRRQSSLATPQLKKFSTQYIGKNILCWVSEYFRLYYFQMYAYLSPRYLHPSFGAVVVLNDTELHVSRVIGAQPRPRRIKSTASAEIGLN